MSLCYRWKLGKKGPFEPLYELIVDAVARAAARFKAVRTGLEHHLEREMVWGKDRRSCMTATGDGERPPSPSKARSASQVAFPTKAVSQRTARWCPPPCLAHPRVWPEISLLKFVCLGLLLSCTSINLAESYSHACRLPEVPMRLVTSWLISSASSCPPAPSAVM